MTDSEKERPPEGNKVVSLDEWRRKKKSEVRQGKDLSSLAGGDFDSKLAKGIGALIENIAGGYSYQDTYVPEECIEHALSLIDSKVVLQMLRQKISKQRFLPLAKAYLKQLIQLPPHKRTFVTDMRYRDIHKNQSEQEVVRGLAETIAFETLNVFFFNNPYVDPHDPLDAFAAYKKRYRIPGLWLPGERILDDIIDYQLLIMNELQSWGDIFDLVCKHIDKRIAELGQQ